MFVKKHQIWFPEHLDALGVRAGHAVCQVVRGDGGGGGLVPPAGDGS